MRAIKFRGQVSPLFRDTFPQLWITATCDEDTWEQFWAVVDRETVGEYIGRTDSYGVEVYEGDVIEYLDNTAQGLIKKTVVIEDIRSLPDLTCSHRETIIGTIYDSPSA